MEEQQADVIIKLPENNQMDYANLFNLRYLTEHGYYNYLDFERDYDFEKNELRIYGIDWSAKGPFIGYITQGNWMYRVSIKEQNRGNVISLTKNESEFTALTIHVPQGAEDSKVTSVIFNIIDDNGQGQFAGIFSNLKVGNNQVHVPKDIFSTGQFRFRK